MRVNDAEPSRPRSTLRPRNRAQTFGLETDADTELSMGRVDPWIGLGWVHYSKSTKIFERIVLIHLKHG